ncbi:MAG: mucoidy inhibitor MuiA family protein [Candidatus Hydrothermales bacterium]
MFSLILFLFFRIEAAVFYPEGAFITEKLEVSLKKGLNTLTLKLLPIVDTNSIKVELKGAEIISTKLKKKTYPKYGDFLKPLQDSLDFLQDTIEKLKIRRENLKRGVEFIQTFKSSYSEKESKEFLEREIIEKNINTALSIIIDKVTSLENNIKKLEEKIREFEFIKTKIQERLSNFHPIGIEEFILSLYINSKIETQTNLTLSYFITSKSGYNLLYKIIGLPDEKKVIINVHSRVFQFTGKNFENVNLSLSTHFPKRNVEPTPLRWTVRSEVPPIKVTEPLLQIKAIQAPETLPEIEVEKPVQEEEFYTSLHYNFPYRATIPSDEKGVILFMKNYEIPVIFNYIFIPRNYKFGFLLAKGTLNTKEILVGGEGNIFLDEEYIGKKRISTIYPGDTLKFYFGEDPFVKAEHILVESEIEKSGIFEKKIRRKFAYKITVKNERKTEIKGTLIAEVPVSDNPDIVINGIEFSKKPFKEDKPQGKYFFEVNLKPNEMFELYYRFNIIHPEEIKNIIF